MHELCFMSNLSNGDWAAWVQALGTIVAVFSSVGLIHYQAKFQRKQKQRYAAAAIDLAINAVEAFGNVPEDFEGAFNYYVCLNTERIEYAYDQLRSFPLHDIDSQEAMIQISRAVDVMREVLRKRRGDLPNGAPHVVKEVIAASLRGDITNLKDTKEKLAIAR
jgi:hypothetical protein